MSEEVEGDHPPRRPRTRRRQALYPVDRRRTRRSLPASRHPGSGQPECQKPIDVDSGVERVYGAEAVDEERRHEEEHEADRRLYDHQAMLKAGHGHDPAPVRSSRTSLT